MDAASAHDSDAHDHGEVDFLGGHPALDALNTVQMTDGELIDTWQSDADVAAWLARHDLAADAKKPRFKAHALLDAARHLRETARALVDARRAGEPVDARALNRFLAQAPRTLELTVDESGEPRLVERHAHGTPEQYLAPLGAAVAELVCEADFALVKKCENPECVLHFLDRTKSHRRRWCSMAMCGNRAKVAAFRRRQQ
ncbi:CGNR zinc finger domain-containing protein [Paraburkholderia sp. J94]|uniref:CGNR zinc finger domain-containing protein n=1 Tax=Paraburkholderia sp. J94 TaxID=2805441 RepID=UPI002AB146B1|nr:ABATE domain-containing protein [Paraburkholderia sp. J94]